LRRLGDCHSDATVEIGHAGQPEFPDPGRVTAAYAVLKRWRRQRRKQFREPLDFVRIQRG
jgi:hypothetical protein